MPALPDGDPAPADGALPPGLDMGRPLRAYVHVPFCTVRCGYCDFNTYTAAELGGAFSMAAYRDALLREIALASHVLQPRPLQSVFVGGGTPSLLPDDLLASVLGGLRTAFGLTPDAEVTLEANPETVTAAALNAWRAAGVTRVSIGMQSADPAVLAVLDRQHTPGRAEQAVVHARDAGFQHVSLDLIYGVPGQSAESWRETVQRAADAGVDHVSAYALVIEPGTRMARAVAGGELAAPDPDNAAGQYEIVDDELSRAGFTWYEISNWARPGGECRHSVGYWHGDNWWGFGPGAHSHVDGVRWWNRKAPAAYSQRLTQGLSPAVGREILTLQERHTERIMLRTRLRDGYPLADLDEDVVATCCAAGWAICDRGRFVLTRQGRLLADAVVRRLLGWQS